jgi:hypothetical protein
MPELGTYGSVRGPGNGHPYRDHGPSAFGEIPQWRREEGHAVGFGLKRWRPASASFGGWANAPFKPHALLSKTPCR